VILENKATLNRIGEYFRQIEDSASLDDAMLNGFKAYRRLFHPVMSAIGDYCKQHIQHTLTTQDAEKVIYAQRLKRLESVVAKLKRFSDMKLSRMEDIGGVRVIFHNLTALNACAETFMSDAQQLTLYRKRNYIEQPKTDGYRGIHLIVEAQNSDTASFPTDTLRAELQLRTQLQHAWATAVEIVGITHQRSYKTGDWQADWKQFFVLTSQMFAYQEMRENEINWKGAFPDSPAQIDSSYLSILEKMQDAADKIKAIDQLSAITIYHQEITAQQNTVHGKSVLLDMNYLTKEIHTYKVTEDTMPMALEFLKAKETEYFKSKAGQVLFVNTQDSKQLQEAYPNFFMDIHVFLKRLNEGLIFYKAMQHKLKP
jgi:ppGpp synthetase/RelA/SpoT-type nucleotidyltranferase